MSMVALYEQAGDKPITRATAQHALSGNLCRCTGYRPIVEAACKMQALPSARLDSKALRKQLKELADTAPAQKPSTYWAPDTLKELLALRKAHPDAQLVAGCTDVGLWVTKQHRQFARVLDTTRVAELRQVDRYPHHIAIGAAVSLHHAFAALVKDRPQLQSFADRFAGLPVRNAGTLGGNVANGSPIGDSMPLLIALGSNIVLASTRGYREMPLETLYTGYRQTCMAADEVLATIKVPRPQRGEQARVYKISKRTEDDISAVCLAIQLHIQRGVVTRASLGAGGVAATPARARATEAALRGQPWNEATVRAAMATLRAEFSPISDMRASGDYRRQVLGNLLWRFWLESQGQVATDIHHLDLELPA
jgi:xanthine dehydrogenase small subunit